MIVTSEVASEVDALVSQEHRYLAILAPRQTTIEQIDRYMYGPALVFQVPAAGNGHIGFVAIVTEHYAQATADRLGSGLYGASVRETMEAAQVRLAELMY
jgi:hypothetical protein